MATYDSGYYDQKWGVYDTFRALGTVFLGYVITAAHIMGDVITGQKDRGDVITAQEDRGDNITGV